MAIGRFYNRSVQSRATPDPHDSQPYERFYGFREQPFATTTDPRFFYLSTAHRRAYSELLNGLRRREGLLMITGETGTGKTTLCRAVIDALGQGTFSAFLVNPYVEGADLLRLVLRDFGLVSRTDLRRGTLASAGVPQLLDTLEVFLTSLVPIGGRAVLVLDEAQMARPAVLDQIRLLHGLEHEGRHLIDLILSGQPTLLETVGSRELAALSERVTRRVQLEPLAASDIPGYVQHRLLIAGGSPNVRFDAAALQAVADLSHGLPRRINVLCDRALQEGREAGATTITAALIRRANDAVGNVYDTPPSELPALAAEPESTPPVEIVAEADDDVADLSSFSSEPERPAASAPHSHAKAEEIAEPVQAELASPQPAPETVATEQAVFEEPRADATGDKGSKSLAGRDDADMKDVATVDGGSRQEAGETTIAASEIPLAEAEPSRADARPLTGESTAAAVLFASEQPPSSLVEPGFLHETADAKSLAPSTEVLAETATVSKSAASSERPALLEPPVAPVAPPPPAAPTAPAESTVAATEPRPAPSDVPHKTPSPQEADTVVARAPDRTGYGPAMVHPPIPPGGTRPDLAPLPSDRVVQAAPVVAAAVNPTNVAPDRPASRLEREMDSREAETDRTAWIKRVAIAGIVLAVLAVVYLMWGWEVRNPAAVLDGQPVPPALVADDPPGPHPVPPADELDARFQIRLRPWRPLAETPSDAGPTLPAPALLPPTPQPSQ
jgi:type II secretory pathway predicted ATPase ExeA